MNETENPSIRRVATKEKLERDVENLKKYSRFAFVLNGKGIEVIDNGERRAKGLPYAKIIAVLGKEGILMEIGYKRTRPYASLEDQTQVGERKPRRKPLPNGEKRKREKRERKEKRWHLKQRPRVRALTEEEFMCVYPGIIMCMKIIVDEERKSWEVKEPWFTKGPGEIQKGIHFTVNHNDTFMHKQMMLEDVRYRMEKYLQRHARKIRWLLRNYQRSYYSRKQLGSFARVRRVKELLQQQHYTPFYRIFLRNYFAEIAKKKTMPHLCEVLDSIIETFEIDISSLTEQEAYALQPSAIVLPGFDGLQCYRLPEQNQPRIQAKGATVFELSPKS
ncbi:MAG: hypothetical protein NTU85_01955 [Candidatus Kaiserbacteria bacterium]|nr:hypothetical protein [Candidatus Kaiserbacteria bacterium]